MSRVTTVGCRRCGGGLAGETFFSNVAEGAVLADTLGKQLMVLEGSGAAIPPVHADATVLVVPASKGVSYVRDYFGPYRLGRADLVVISFAEEPAATTEMVDELREAIRQLAPGVPVVATTFRPVPIENIEGQRVLFATTAPAHVAPQLAEHLESEWRCQVVGTSTALSNRALLREDLARFEGSFDVLLTELKAAAIDVVAAEGKARGVSTVLCDNVPVAVDGSDLPEQLLDVARLARSRAKNREEARQ